MYELAFISKASPETLSQTISRGFVAKQNMQVVIFYES